MEAFQKELNQNREEFRRMKWGKHRDYVTGLFDRVFLKKGTVDKVAIFGAGNCDDLDLDHLASKCHSIYLFDIDAESMKRGMKNFSETTCNKIELVEHDVTGLSKIDFEHQLPSLFESRKNSDEILKFLKDTENRLGKIVEDEWTPFTESFDIVSTSAIYTQLFYNWALEVLSKYENQYNQDELIRIKEGFLDLRDQIVLTFNDSVRRCCKVNGFFIMWSDILKMESKYTEIIKEGPNAIFALASTVGFGASLIAIQDFIAKVEKEDFFLTYWPWDFNEDKQYLVMGMLGKNWNDFG